MKRFKIAVVILITVIAVSIVSTMYISYVCEDLIENLNTVIKYVRLKDLDNTAIELQNVIDKFEKARPFLNVLLGQGETNEIRGDLNKAIFFINMKSSESSLLYLEECKMDLNKIITGNLPSISTIL